ncbi:unnamed protein product [Spirodela intermedia]|uniref:Uncharacterized protein n=1 Tax=Spirodela intermedia TaxID=51605 RepID=A0A7I8JD69_SPIIN|nr:unnamed protein product [Spirodela intermedia]CAA6667951.1 unnamed protein product [Spirodela intermedia]
MHREISPGNPNPNPNPNSPMPGFCYFLHALARIQQDVAPQRSPGRRGEDPSRRLCSMAVAAAPRRMAWSRALLRRLRRRSASPRRKTITVTRKKTRKERQEDELRRLVPAGRRMDLCSLLEETGDYLQCLAAQVSLMQWVARSISE